MSDPIKAAEAFLAKYQPPFVERELVRSENGNGYCVVKDFAEPSALSALNALSDLLRDARRYRKLCEIVTDETGWYLTNGRTGRSILNAEKLSAELDRLLSKEPK